MGRSRTIFSRVTLSALIALSCAHSASAGEPGFKKVMLVLFENMDYKEVIGQPFFGGLARTGVNMANFYAEVHPSQANYIALTSGSLQGVKGDGNVDLDVRHIGDLLEAK